MKFVVCNKKCSMFPTKGKIVNVRKEKNNRRKVGKILQPT